MTYRILAAHIGAGLRNWANALASTAIGSGVARFRMKAFVQKIVEGVKDDVGNDMRNWILSGLIANVDRIR
jgi:hypothetical protein